MTETEVRSVGDRVAGGLVLGAAGLGTGLWLWSIATPRARVLAPDGGVVFLHGRSAWPLDLAVASGVAIVVLAAVALTLAIRRWGGSPSEPMLLGGASLAPAALLGLVALARLLPMGPLTGPVAVLLDDGRWVLLAAVVLTVVAGSRSRFDRHGAAGPVPAVAQSASHSPSRWSPGRVVALVFGVVAAVNLALLPRAVLVGPTGDEPDYLLLAHSLVVDRDLDLRNQIEQKDYQRFTGRLQPHVRKGPGGGLYTAHRPGLPLLVAPAYALGFWTGWPVRVTVMVELALLAAWLAARLAAWASALGGDITSAACAALLVAFTAPGFYYAFAIYPELPAALVVLEALAWIGRGAPGTGWGPGLLVASLPWLHEKFLPLTVALAGLGLVAAGTRRRWVLVGLGVPLGASALLQVLYYERLYGAPIPVGVHAGFAWSSLHAGLVGLGLDRDHGLLPLAPVFLVAVAGIPALARGAPVVAAAALAAFASLYLVVGSYREWWGGFAPPPRYLVPMLPVLGLALAFGLREWRRRGRGLRAALLAAASLAVSAPTVAVPALQYRHAHPIRSLLPAVDWPRYLPGWVAPDGRTWPLTLLAVVLATLALRMGADRALPRRLPAGLGLTGAGLVTLAVLGLAVAGGDRLSGVSGPTVSREVANAELRALLDAVAARGEPPWRVTARPPQAPEAVRLVYPARRLPGRGRMVPDPLADDGQARLAEEAGVDVVFGPYERLPRGRYQVDFRLRAAHALSGPIATVGVTAARGKVSLGARDVKGETLATDAYREVGVEIVLPAATGDLEWRVRGVEPDAVLVDGVVVRPLDLRLVDGDPP